MDWHAVVDDVQVRLCEIDHSPTAGILDVGILNVPFLRAGPVEDASAGRNLPDAKVDFAADDPKRLFQPVARDASTDGIELTNPLVHFSPDCAEVERISQGCDAHELVTRRRLHSPPSWARQSRDMCDREPP